MDEGFSVGFIGVLVGAFDLEICGRAVGSDGCLIGDLVGVGDDFGPDGDGFVTGAFVGFSAVLGGIGGSCRLAIVGALVEEEPKKENMLMLEMTLLVETTPI